MVMWAPIAAAGISAVGGMLGGMSANSSAKKIARMQMDFQERMSNTAHQREVADLRLAGLNPILSANGGSGASSPVGASAPVVNVGETASRAASSAMDSIRTQKELAIADAQIAKLKSDANTSDTQGALNTALFLKTKQDTQNSALDGLMKTSALPALQNEAAYQRSVGTAAPWVKNVLGGLKDVLGVTHSAKALKSSPAR